MLCFHKDEDRHVYFPNLAKVSALADHTIVVNSDQTFFSHDNVCVQKKTYYMTFCRFWFTEKEETLTKQLKNNEWL